MGNMKIPYSKNLLKFLVDTFDTPIATGLAFALWIIPLHLLLNIQITENDYENIKQFIEWFGVPYGLLMALVLVNVWTQFDQTDRAFDREADALLSFYNTSRMVLNKKIKNDINKALAHYIKHVNDHFSDEFNSKSFKHQGDNILNEIREQIGKIIKGKNNKELGVELLKLVNELIDDRGDRLSYSKQRMPSTVMSLSLITSFLWLAPFFFLNFENIWMEIFFLAGVTLTVVSILLIILDLDSPIGGTWGVNLESWEDLIEKIEN